MAINYLIVISILEGKNFPVRHDKLLVVEAKFDGEVMSTDPASHANHPDFNTELAWEVDKKGLQMHRLQRTPIKLLWYAVDLELTRKESIGYIILDIRLAQEKLQNPRWLPLLNCKYQKEKPEVLLSLFLEREAEQMIPTSLPGNHVPGSIRRSSLVDDRNGKKKMSNGGVEKVVVQTPCYPTNHNNKAEPELKPILLSNAGCYQIGPPEQCIEKFVFSVTLAFAANLNKLTPPAMLKSSKGFYFYYSFFENDVTTEKFSSLSNPDFPAERASVRISSSSKILSEYFEKHPNLEVLLCTGDVSLGSGKIPLGPLSCVNKNSIKEEPLCIEGSVQILPIEKTSRAEGDDLSPFVGVTVVLQKDEGEAQTPKEKTLVTPLREKSIPEENSSRMPSQSPQKPNHSFMKKVTCSKNDDIPHRNHDTHPVKNGSPGQTIASHTPRSVPETPVAMRCNYSLGNTSIGDGLRNIAGRPSSISMSSDISTHHFSFTLDLCKFQATRLAHPISLFIRYSYPFFGISTSVVTHPYVEVHPKCEISIPHGYCAFKFSTTFTLLKSTFWETPLILEVLHHTKQGQEQTVGTARINLFQVLDAPRVNRSVDKKYGTQQRSKCKVVVTSTEGYEIGEIFADLTLEDLGQSSSLCDHRPTQLNPASISQVHNFIPNFEVPLLRQNGLTQDDLLQAALELELWQERQREIFRAQLKDKEIQHLSVLTSEWKQRDMERELLLQRKLQECRKLEDKLKQTLQDAELKEKQLSSQENELAIRLQNVDKLQEQQQIESKNHIESIKMEYTELLTIERLNARDLEQKNNAFMRQIKELERELQEQRNTIESMKTQINKDPDVQLRTEVNILNMEKSELQQKLEAASTSKHKYKIQWGQAVRQISLLQQKLHLMERLEMTKKDEELANLQQRVLATEEKTSAQSNEEILEMVKDKVESLKSAVTPDNVRRLLDRQLSVEDNPAQSSDSSITTVRSNSNSHIPVPTVSNSNAPRHPLSAKHTPNPSMNCIKPNANASKIVKVNVNPSTGNFTETSDMNGNTKSKEYNLRTQHLIAQKEKLMNTGIYKEDDQIIKELTVHINNAKLITK